MVKQTSGKNVSLFEIVLCIIIIKVAGINW